MQFIFLGLYAKTIRDDIVTINIDELLEKVNSDFLFRKSIDNGFLKSKYFKFEDLSIEPIDVPINLNNLDFLNYIVYLKDEAIGYTNYNFLYSGLKFLRSKENAQYLIPELEKIIHWSSDLTFFRRRRQVGVFEWLDQVLKADPHQIHRHYLIKRNYVQEVYLNLVQNPSKVEFLWGVNFPEFASKNQELLTTLTTILNVITLRNKT